MLYQIVDGTLTFGEKMVLSHADFEIHGTERIALVGENGAGKTSLLKIIAGQLTPDRDDRRKGACITTARELTVGMLEQQFPADSARTVEDIFSSFLPEEEKYDRERFFWEKEADALFTGLGMRKEDKKRKISEFSGGEQTKIALIIELLKRPDILLLDEPTNHLDVKAVEWLEQYLKTYDRAVVLVSHDRFFLDETAEVVYELENGVLTRFPGNYTQYREEKKKRIIRQKKAYEQYEKETERLQDLILRFRDKPRKAAFARAKRKELERLRPVEKPKAETEGFTIGDIDPLFQGSKRVLEAERMQIGYDRTLLELTLHVKRGQKIGILGSNGAGKSTFLKTVAGLLPSRGGEFRLGNRITMGYFDQNSAGIKSEQSVLEHFHNLFPSLTEREVRSILGAYLFGGREAAKKVDSLSGGEKARLVLAELLQGKPNLLLLDEPTNHMDIRAKERLEEAFSHYRGTMLFVSHDRYFVEQLADAILIFEGREVFYYPFGYRHYLEHCVRRADGVEWSARRSAQEQALIDGMRAVPRPEKRFFREASSEEEYRDWKLRLAGEELAGAAEIYEKKMSRKTIEKENYESSEEFWNEVLQWGKIKKESNEQSGFVEKERDSDFEAWHEACLAWYEACEEILS